MLFEKSEKSQKILFYHIRRRFFKYVGQNKLPIFPLSCNFRPNLITKYTFYCHVEFDY